MRLGWLAIAPLLTVSGAPPPPVVFVEQAPRIAALTRLLVLENDGGWANVAGTVRQASGRPVRFERRRAYQVYCGAWRATPDGAVAVRETLAESFGPPAPADAGAWRTAIYRKQGGPGEALGPTLATDGVRFRQVAAPLDTTILEGLRAQCASARNR